MKNCLQVYTGNGKGKTTASLGLAVRSLGFGTSVFIGQFMKKGKYNEIEMLKQIGRVLKNDQKLEIQQYGSGEFIWGTPSESDIKLAEEGFEKVFSAVSSGEFGLVIADELNVALSIGLLKLDDVLKLIKCAKSTCELVFTGRNAEPRIIEIADLVTEMKEIKHYMNSGLDARDGIEM